MERPLDQLLRDPITVIEQSPEMPEVIKLVQSMIPPAEYPVTDINKRRKQADEMYEYMEATKMGMMAEVPEDWRERTTPLTIKGPAGDLPLLILTPKTDIKGAMLHIHGGGWCLGNPKQTAPLLMRLVDDLGIVIASVDYRLAPEDPYPAALDDCEAAALWWIDDVRKKYNIEKIVVGGESAGAHLSAVTTIRMRQKHDYKFSGAKLTYGLYDFGNGLPSRIIADGKNLSQDSRACDFYADVFVPDKSLRKDPDVSPIYADLTDMPPALFTVGTLDPFLDDNIVFANRWLTSGNQSNLIIYKGSMHGLDMMPSPEAAHHYKLNIAFMKKYLF